MLRQFYSQTLGCKVQQVSIRKAARLFAEGETIYMIGCRMRFDNPWQHPCPVSKENSYTDNFDHLVFDFRYYNCDNERGRYPHYYVKLKAA